MGDEFTQIELKIYLSPPPPTPNFKRSIVIICIKPVLFIMYIVSAFKIEIKLQKKKKDTRDHKRGWYPC